MTMPMGVMMVAVTLAFVLISLVFLMIVRRFTLLSSALVLSIVMFMFVTAIKVIVGSIVPL